MDLLLNICCEFIYNRLEKKIAQINTRIEKIKRDMQNKEDTKTVALGTSKINYLDPRITVAWCKRHEVPIEKVRSSNITGFFFFKCFILDGLRIFCFFPIGSR